MFLDGYFEPRNKGKIQAHHKDQFELLLTTLDLLVAGRCLEAGDVLAGHMRQLVYGLEEGDWKVAKEFLAYRRTTSSLIDDTWRDAAFREAERTAKREKRRAGVAQGAGKAAR